MFRSVSQSVTLWEAVLPEEVLVMPPVLAGADRWLADPGLVEVYRPFFSATSGRYSIPMDSYLRLMFLKWYLGVGYERLCVEVAGNVTFRLFTRVGLCGTVPDPSTLKRITARCGPGPVETLNDLMIRAGAACGEVDVSRVRVDTTFVDANIRHPRDSSLLGEAIRTLLTKSQLLVDRLGLDVGVDPGADAELVGLQGELARWGRSRHPGRVDEILVCTDQIAQLTAATAEQAASVVTAARRAITGRQRVPRGVRRAINTMTKVLGSVDQLVYQAVERARERPVPAADKRVSLHDGDARPMRKATTAHKGVQFAYTAEITEDNNGLIVDHQVHVGQPGDATLIGPAITRVTTRTGTTPTVVAADGTFGAAHTREELTNTGVGLVAIKALGNPSPAQQELETSSEFTLHRQWRAGVEARISHLKRDFGWDRTRMSNHTGARTWLGWGVFAHNTQKLALRI